MFRVISSSFADIYTDLRRGLLDGEVRNEVNPGEWHSKPMDMDTFELQNVIFETHIPRKPGWAAGEVEPNMPWAEDHFLERVSGIPLNPPPSSLSWGGIDDKDAVRKHMTTPVFMHDHRNPANEPQGFSHTYPERFWPKAAGVKEGEFLNKGIRDWYGDLNDVVNLLRKNPLTRQAYLPVWFPEDTGAVHGERVPCTLGYHFLIRDGNLNVTYMIRSVDFVRNFRDDVYLAMRLGQWMCQRMRPQGVAVIGENSALPTINHRPSPGKLTMLIMSLHCFHPDLVRLQKEAEDERVAANTSQ